MIDLFLWFACIAYAIEYTFFLFGQRRVPGVRRQIPQAFPRVSVVVAARNEARNIEQCLASLARQDYPADLLQIVAVDDESEDSTHALMLDEASKHDRRIDIVSTHNVESTARGKARAIAHGIDHATGEIILLTDADCIAPTTWARATV
ncbi:MAG: glycosyltransferase, partial [bacterium]|nr:glycosyltransferase [Candidatus Kapabacteria bacterium]